MRESIGGTMLFWIVLFFMSIFISFMAFVINYARVYKIKNSMINYLERQEGVMTKEQFEAELSMLGYPQKDNYRFCRYHPTDIGGYYYLELYMALGFPLLNNLVTPIRITIKGETRTIETGTLIKDGNAQWQCLENNGCCTR